MVLIDTACSTTNPPELNVWAPDAEKQACAGGRSTRLAASLEGDREACDQNQDARRSHTGVPPRPRKLQTLRQECDVAQERRNHKGHSWPLSGVAGACHAGREGAAGPIIRCLLDTARMTAESSAPLGERRARGRGGRRRRPGRESAARRERWRGGLPPPRGAAGVDRAGAPRRAAPFARRTLSRLVTNRTVGN